MRRVNGGGYDIVTLFDDGMGSPVPGTRGIEANEDVERLVIAIANPVLYDRTVVGRHPTDSIAAS